jgi:hypothetical protein
MNHCVFTGWLPQDADARVTPSGRTVLAFRLMVKDSRAEDQQLCFRCDDEQIVGRCREYLTRGRTVIVHAEARRMEMHKLGGVAGDYTGFAVLACEIPNRAKAVEAGDNKAAEPAEVAS